MYLPGECYNHALACAADGDRISRHDRLRDVVFNSAAKAALAPDLEKANLTSRSRPGDIYLPCWSRGRPATLDMTVISFLQSSTLQTAVTSAGHALEVSDERTFTKHLSACEEAGISFVPLSVDALGSGLPLPLKPFNALLRWQQRALPVPTPRKLLAILCNSCQLSCKKGNSTLLLSQYCS